MHEASIILNILDTVTKICHKDGYEKINSIRLKIGKASSIMADSLEFAFEISKKDTIASEAELLIESVPLTGQCHTCSKTFEPGQKFVYTCPFCQSSSFEIISGYEMEIVDMEVD